MATNPTQERIFRPFGPRRQANPAAQGMMKIAELWRSAKSFLNRSTDDHASNSTEGDRLEKRAEKSTMLSMLIDTIREFNRAVPFQPYEIRTNGGERLLVPHPDFIFVAPKGGWIIVTDEYDRPRHISSILIEEVSPATKRRFSKRSSGRK